MVIIYLSSLLIILLPLLLLQKGFDTTLSPPDELAAQTAGYKSKTILHSKYEAVSPANVALQQLHLTPS